MYSSQVVAMEQQVDAIKQQIIAQTRDIIGNSDKDPKLNNVIAQFAWIKLESDFAQTELTAAQQVVEAAKVNISKEANAMIVIDPPKLPDDYAYPRKIYDIVTVFIGLLIFYLIGKMIIIIIQEHRD